MTCIFHHNWSWPRRRGGRDMQVCLVCGEQRESKVRFDPPRYTKTQDGIPNFAPGIPRIERKVREIHISRLPSVA